MPLAENVGRGHKQKAWTEDIDSAADIDRGTGTGRKHRQRAWSEGTGCLYVYKFLLGIMEDY